MGDIGDKSDNGGVEVEWRLCGGERTWRLLWLGGSWFRLGAREGGSQFGVKI